MLHDRCDAAASDRLRCRETLGDVSPEFAVQAFLTMLVVIDPPGIVPVFVSLTGGRPPTEQRLIAQRAVVIAGIVLLAFAVVFRPVLAYLGISVGALLVAAGILLFRIAVEMVFGQFRRETPEEEAEALVRDDISVFPLAIPLTAGPGAIASVLVLTSEAGGDPVAFAVVIGATMLVLALAYGALRMSVPITRLLGRTGISVVTRVLGLILAALAVQYVANGLSTLFPKVV